ncbi:Digalactosyldiacylglycerol synthase [Vigna angularis]|nr:Digalactosyldiacylglycerol synthase [Vigna angularis]
MRDRANSFKDLATSFDRELENFFNFATSSFSVPAMRSPPPREIEFVKSLCPKLSEIRRAYSSPDLSKRVLEKWSSRSRIRINLSVIEKSIVLAEEDGIMDFEKRGRRLSFSEEWKNEGEGESNDWEPIRALKIRLKEFEKHDSSLEAFKKVNSWKKSSLAWSVLLPLLVIYLVSC